jgi:hypothetical protein
VSAGKCFAWLAAALVAAPATVAQCATCAAALPPPPCLSPACSQGWFGRARHSSPGAGGRRYPSPEGAESPTRWAPWYEPEGQPRGAAGRAPVPGPAGALRSSGGGGGGALRASSGGGGGRLAGGVPRPHVRVGEGAAGRAAALRAQEEGLARGGRAWGSGAGELVGDRVARHLLRESIRQPALRPATGSDSGSEGGGDGSGGCSEGEGVSGAAAPAARRGSLPAQEGMHAPGSAPAEHGGHSGSGGGAGAAWAVGGSAGAQPGSASLEWHQAAARGRWASLGGVATGGWLAGGMAARSMLRGGGRRGDAGEGEHKLRLEALLGSMRGATGARGWRNEAAICP